MPPATSYSNDELPKLYRPPPTARAAQAACPATAATRCLPAADMGQRVLWLDGTTGYTNLVKRDRPAGTC